MKNTASMFALACVLAGAGGFAAPVGIEMGIAGNLQIGSHEATMQFMIHHERWNGRSTGVKKEIVLPDATTGTASFDLFRDKENDRCGHGNATLLALADGRVLYSVSVVSDADLKPEATVLSLEMPCRTFCGGKWTASCGAAGELPATYGKMQVCGVWTKSLSLTAAGGKEPFTLTFPSEAYCMIQDNRRWSESFSLRISPNASRAFDKGEQKSFTCIISSPEGVKMSLAAPVKISRGKDWIPLDYRKNIEAGSALDFSGMGLQDAPAGKYGWLKNAGGHFEFEGRPGVRQRFYGVNLCFDANFPEKELADELVTRLVRLGYNTVRVHHYEGHEGVVKGSKDRLAINEERTKRLDYLLFRLMEKGVYITTDLYTARRVLWRDIGIDRDGAVEKQIYKNLVGVHGPAFENWKTFAKNFLTHVNPYTGRRYADEPGLPLISLINEGNLIWCWGKIKTEAPMKAAWKKWLASKRAADPGFAKGVPDDAAKVLDQQCPALVQFMADVEADLSRREREFLVSIGVKAMLTSQNCGKHFTPLMAMRETCYDYVDDHFYVDHPNFLGGSWRLPSRCVNSNPVKFTHAPFVACAFTRMPSKPFCITEWNFSGPGMFRGVGGIMTGAMGALQEWDGLWRFSYSHCTENLLDRSGFPGYFDVGSDPLSQASDRASVCLFLRRDMEPLRDMLVQTVTPDTFMPADGKATPIVPEWRNHAWQVRTGTAVAPAPEGARTVNLGAQRSKTELPFRPAPSKEMVLDREAGTFKIDTPRTAGGFTPNGALAAGPVSFDAGDVSATVWASSLDGKPLPQSSRILVTHLTDVQADGNVYADKAKTTLIKWGAYPPLVRNGSAKVSLALSDPAAFTVWGLDTTGKRLDRIPSSVRDGKLVFTASVEGSHGARMLYEVAR